MTITISHTTEALLTRRAQEQGATAEDVADMILFRSLMEEESNGLADFDPFREAIEQEQHGKYRPFADYVADHEGRFPSHTR